MIMTNHGGKPIAKVGYSIVSVVLAISFVIIGPAEALAQGTNASSTAGGAGGEMTIVMPAGSVDPNAATGYEPSSLTVSPGSAVVWDNQDNALHTATSGNPDTATPDGKFDTGMVGASTQSQPVTMPTEPGEYTYFCTLHPFLVGTVVVQ